MSAGGGTEDFSYSRDILRRFAGEKTAPTEVAGGDFREVDLSLGLSLGGCFGDQKEKGLVLSSSVFRPESQTYADAGEGTIGRTWSLPAESEEWWWRRRKEMQCLKRMEAKRKRSEKQAKEETAAAAKGPAPRLAGAGKPALQVSIGSSGSSSSVVLDFESNPLHGVDATALNGSVEVRSPPVSFEHANKKAVSSPMLSKPTNPPKEEDEPSKKRTRTKEMERNMMMEEMPCVSTRGDGPNGRRIEGFLYNYRKGEEVRIVCFCHGSFLTPAEFVKHAGGGEVDHPLKHIVVNPNPSVVL